MPEPLTLERVATWVKNRFYDMRASDARYGRKAVANTWAALQTFGAGVTVTGNVTTSGFLICSPQTVAIASGAVTATGSYLVVTPEGGAADDLVTINGGASGMLVILRNASSSAAITVTETGNIDLGAATRSLPNRNDKLFLLYNGATSKWEEISYAAN